jgi:hypothetical protein
MRDYSEAEFKMDKYMPEDENAQNEYYEILDSEQSREEKVASLTMFFYDNADESVLRDYFPEGGTVEEFAEYLMGEK